MEIPLDYTLYTLLLYINGSKQIDFQMENKNRNNNHIRDRKCKD